MFAPKKQKVNTYRPVSNKAIVRTLAFLLFVFSTTQIGFAQNAIENMYAETKWINHKFFIARIDSLWGVVDKENTIILPFRYTSIALNQDVYKYMLKGQNGKMGFVDMVFDKIIEPSYDSITVFKTGNKNYLKCWKDGTSSVFNQQSRLLFTQNCSDFISLPGKPDLHLIKGMNQKWGLVNAQNELEIPFAYDSLIYNPNLQVTVKTKDDDLFFFSAKREGMFGLINFRNTIIVPFEYDYIEVLNENHILSKKNGKYGSIDSLGNVVIPYNYNEAELFIYHSGQGPFIKVQNDLNQAGLYDRTGKMIIDEKYQYKNFKLSDELPGYSIEVSDGINNYFSTVYNDFQMIPFIKKEPVGGNNVNGVYIYTHPNGKKCIVGGNHSALCENSFEWLDDFEKISKDGKEFLKLERKDSSGKIKYGIRDVWYGKCLSSIIFDRLDFNVTEEHIQYFKPQKNEVILAVGHIKKSKSEWIISNFDVRQIKKGRQ
jgi:hypothetical protein